MVCEARNDRRPGKLRKNWIDTVRQDLKEIDKFWNETQESCADREDWRRFVGPLCLQHGLNQ